MSMLYGALLSVDFVLEAFENEFSLFVFVLSYPIFGVDFVFLIVEHVVAKVEDSPPVHFCGFSFYIMWEIPYLLVFS